MAFLRQVGQFLDGFRGVMALALVCAVAHTLLGLVPALFVREVVARVSGAPGAAFFAHWSLGTLGGRPAYLARGRIPLG